MTATKAAGSEKAPAKKAPAKKPAAKKPAAKKTTEAAKPEAEVEVRVPAGSRKSLADMSESHRAHVLRWEPHLENLGAEFVWNAVSRFSGHGQEGPHYVAIRRGSKDYAIIAYDTANPVKTNKRHVVDEGMTTSTALMESFKGWREKARDERAVDAGRKGTPAGKKTPVRKKKPAPTED